MNENRTGRFESGGVKLVLAGRQPAAGATAAVLCGAGTVHPGGQLDTGMGGDEDITPLKRRRAGCPDGGRQTDFFSVVSPCC